MEMNYRCMVNVKVLLLYCKQHKSTIMIYPLYYNMVSDRVISVRIVAIPVNIITIKLRISPSAQLYGEVK